MTTDTINSQRLQRVIETIVKSSFAEIDRALTREQLMAVPVGTILKATFKDREEGMAKANCRGYYFGWGCISRINGHICWVDAMCPFDDDNNLYIERSSYSGQMLPGSKNYDCWQLVAFDDVYVTRPTQKELDNFKYWMSYKWGKDRMDEVFSRHLPASTPGTFVETTVKTTVIEQSSENTDVKKKPAYVPFDDETRQLRPFVTKVLVCNGEGTMWIPAVFGCFKDHETARGTHRYYVAVGGNVYSHCIPFQKNRTLNGKYFKADD